MNGRYFLDTNAIIFLLRDGKAYLEQFETAEWLGISVLSKIEFLAFPKLSENDKRAFSVLEQRIAVVNIEISNQHLIEKAIEFRSKYKLKLPDALIAASASEHSAILITNDKQLLNLPFLQSQNFN